MDYVLENKSVRRSLLIVTAFFWLTVFIIFASLPVIAQSEKVALDMYQVGDYNSTLTPGEDNPIFIEIRNSGNAVFTDIVFSYIAPKDWTVIFSPENITTLEPGSYQTIEVNIKPSAVSDSRSNNITLIAQCNETRQVLNIYTRVEHTTGLWLWVGLGIAIVVIAVFTFVFFRTNRMQ
jgi:uncharacterized membrane protein